MMYLSTANGLKTNYPKHNMKYYLLRRSTNKRKLFHCSAALKGKDLACRSQFSVLTDFTEPQNGLGWKGSLEVIMSNPAVQTGPCRADCLGLFPGGSWILPKMGTPQSLWVTCQHHNKKGFSYVQTQFPMFYFVPMASRTGCQ